MTPVGFDVATITVTSEAGASSKVNLWVADTPDERGRGLMGVTDLGEGEGMLFVFEEAEVRRFYMWQTPMPLSIAFFDESGGFIASDDMEPCLESTAANCERYAPEEPFLMAIEVPSGTLDDLGIEEGSRITIA